MIIYIQISKCIINNSLKIVKNFAGVKGDNIEILNSISIPIYYKLIYVYMYIYKISSMMFF